MDTWMRVHEVTTRQEWEGYQLKRAQPETFYARWAASNQRLQEWLQANSFHVERDD